MKARLRHRLRQLWDTYRHAARHRDDAARLQALCETTAADRDRLATEAETQRHAFETTAADRGWSAEEISAHHARSATRVRDDDDLMLGTVVFMVWQRDGNPETLARRTLEWINDFGGTSNLPQSLLTADDLESRIPDAIIRYADVAFRVQRSADHLLPLVRFALDNQGQSSQSFYQRHVANVYFNRSGQEEGGDEEKIKEAAAFERDFIARAVAEGKISRNPERAHLRGLFVQTLPKSGTAFLRQTLQKSLDVRGVIAKYRSTGNFLPRDPDLFRPYLATLGLSEENFGGPRLIVYWRLAPDLLSLGAQQGGVILNGHAPGRPENLAVMREQGIDKAVILMRDPRQAAISGYHYQLRPGNLTLEATKQLETDPEAKNLKIRRVFLADVLWNNSWLAARDAGDIRIHIVRFEDMAQDATAVIASIYDFWGLSLADYPPVFPEKNAATHFRAGKTDTWKTDLDEETKAVMAEVMEKVPCGY